MIKNTLINNLLDELFPDSLTCMCCNDELNSNEYLCENCHKDLNFITNACLKCGQPINDFSTLCKDCKGIKRNFTKAVSPLVYDGTAKHLVYKLKYGGAKHIAKELAKHLVAAYKKADFKNIDIITAVPLNNERLKTRGYNQAQVLAQEMCCLLECENNQIVQNYKLIKRVKNTPTQTSLTKIERKENLRDAFEFIGNIDDVRDKNILIIDDIFTTGATMEELTSVLKKQKVSNVYCLTCCHTPKFLKNSKDN